MGRRTTSWRRAGTAGLRTASPTTCTSGAAGRSPGWRTCRCGRRRSPRRPHPRSEDRRRPRTETVTNQLFHLIEINCEDIYQITCNIQ